MQVLVKSATDGKKGANMGFFKQLPGGGFELHFLGSSKEEKKDFWRSMRFDADFVEVMKQYGQLPPTTVEDLVAQKTDWKAEKTALITKHDQVLAEEKAEKTALIAKHDQVLAKEKADLIAKHDQVLAEEKAALIAKHD